MIIDIHCHILPGIDDGPSDWEESIEMARIASSDGTRVLVATPHWFEGTKWQPTKDEIYEKVEKLNQLLVENEIELTVYSGMEISISENVKDQILSQSLIPLAGSNYVLLEVPYISLPFGIEEMIFQLTSSEYNLIFAHPERCSVFQKDPSSIKRYKDIGVMMQITAGSLTGLFGQSAQQCAINFAELDCIDIIASDGHSETSRPPIISDGINVWQEVSGKETVEKKIKSTVEKLGIV